MATKVTLRQKPISGNRLSLYLDFYPPVKHMETGELTRREFLNLFIFNEFETEEQTYHDANGKEKKRIVSKLHSAEGKFFPMPMKIKIHN